jgi:hypothetical protein
MEMWKFLSLPGLELPPRLVVQPVASRYTDWAIAAPGNDSINAKFNTEKFESRLNLGNFCYHSVQNLSSSCLLSYNVTIKTYKTRILPVVLYGCETWPLTLIKIWPWATERCLTERQTGRLTVGCHSLMELSPSWEADNCAATQELPSILYNPKVHYRFCPPLVHILSQINPIHHIPSYHSKITFNIAHPLTSWSS